MASENFLWELSRPRAELLAGGHARISRERLGNIDHGRRKKAKKAKAISTI